MEDESSTMPQDNWKDEMLSDILDKSWSQADAFKNIFNEDDEGVQELMAIFEAGSMTKNLLLESLSHLGWVCKDEADFLPEQWFMKMKYSQKGQVTFVFLTGSLDILANPEEALEYMTKNDYDKSDIETFENNFKAN